jgi:hypothetical protein
MEFYEEKKTGWYMICTVLLFVAAKLIYSEVIVYFGFNPEWFVEVILVVVFIEIIARTISRVAYISKGSSWYILENGLVKVVETGWRWIRPRTIFSVPRREFYLNFPLVYLNMKSPFGWTIRIRLDNSDLTSIGLFASWVYKLKEIYNEKGQNQKDLRLRVSIEIDNAVRNPDARFTVLERVNL